MFITVTLIIIIIIVYGIFYKCSLNFRNWSLRSWAGFWIGREEAGDEEGQEAEWCEAEEESGPSSSRQDCSTEGSNQKIVDNIAGEQKPVDGSSVLVSKGLNKIDAFRP